MASIYSDFADNYRENGVSAIPCAAGAKFPGKFSKAHGWWAAPDWQRFCSRMPTDFDTRIWDQWPDAGICAPLGSASGRNGFNLVAIDIDTDVSEEVAAIRSVLPGSPIAKRGAKGSTEFYLAPKSVISCAFNDAHKRRMLDLLADGRQTVVPPTLHPDTGNPYVWLTLDTLENFDVADLPVLPNDIADRLGDALKPFGYQPAEVRLGTADGVVEAETPHRTLNETALANLSAWVPALQLYKCRQVGGKYKAVAVWRPSSSGRSDSQRATNLAISPDGIKDCGDNKGYTPIDLVMAACECDLDQAFRWLQERVMPAPALRLTAKPPVLDFEPVQEMHELADRPRRTSLKGLLLATINGAHVRTEPTVPAVEDVTPTPAHIIPPELCTPPGMIGDIVEWMNASTDRPSPQMNLGATIAFLGSVMGRRFEHPSQGARTNFYCIAVGTTGVGKNHPLKAIDNLAERAGISRFLGPEEVKSESALRKVLEEKPTVCCLWDELGRFMRRVNSPRASTHEAGISGLMLKLFSKANVTYRGAEGAVEKAVPIINPNLCIYGASTPRDLYDNLSSSSVDDGFLPRWLVFDAGPRAEGYGQATAQVDEPPAELRKALHTLLDVRPTGNLNGVTMNKPIRAAWGPGAEDFFRAERARLDREIARAETDGRRVEEAIKSRVIEHAVKLSLLYAVSSDFNRPMITVAGLQWGIEIATISANAHVRGIEGNIADNDGHAEFLSVKRLIMAAGTDGVLVKQIRRQIDGRFNERRLGEILGQLEAQGFAWRAVRVGPSGRGAPGDRIGMWGADREAS